MRVTQAMRLAGARIIDEECDPGWHDSTVMAEQVYRAMSQVPPTQLTPKGSDECPGSVDGRGGDSSWQFVICRVRLDAR